MKLNFSYLLLAVLLFGCGTDTKDLNPNEQIALKVIQQYNFQTEGEPQMSDGTLPSELTDANWGLKEIVCQQAGYDLTPYAGQTVSLMRYSLREEYTPVDEPLYLWIVIKDNSCICAYATVRENSGLIPGVFAVNDPAFSKSPKNPNNFIEPTHDNTGFAFDIGCYSGGS